MPEGSQVVALKGSLLYFRALTIHGDALNIVWSQDIYTIGP